MSDYPELETFNILPYTAAFSTLKRNNPPRFSSARQMPGVAFAPRVAARFRTGLTADCTVLEMKENTDSCRFVRLWWQYYGADYYHKNPPAALYRTVQDFSAPERKHHGTVRRMTMDEQLLRVGSRILDIKNLKQMDISEADCIVAVGRGVKARRISLAEYLPIS